jgi:uncharacterized protein (TIGR00106 family)
MSVIVDLTIFPTDKGASVSSYVARAVRLIKESGLPYQFGPMSTSIEGKWEDVMSVVNRCFAAMQPDCNRIYMIMKADYRKGMGGRISGKVRSVEDKLAEGEIVK